MFAVANCNYYVNVRCIMSFKLYWLKYKVTKLRDAWKKEIDYRAKLNDLAGMEYAEGSMNACNQILQEIKSMM